MSDFLKIGDKYLKTTQDVFFNPEKDNVDVKANSISVSLIINWFTVILPVSCVLVYGIKYLKGRCKSQISSKTIIAELEVSSKTLPAELESYRNYKDYLGCAASKLPDSQQYGTLFLKNLCGKTIVIDYSQEALVGHVKALLCAHEGYTFPRIIYAGKCLESEMRVSYYIKKEMNSTVTVREALPAKTV